MKDSGAVSARVTPCAYRFIDKYCAAVIGHAFQLQPHRSKDLQLALAPHFIKLNQFLMFTFPPSLDHSC